MTSIRQRNQIIQIRVLKESPKINGTLSKKTLKLTKIIQHGDSDVDIKNAENLSDIEQIA